MFGKASEFLRRTAGKSGARLFSSNASEAPQSALHHLSALTLGAAGLIPFAFYAYQHEKPEQSTRRERAADFLATGEAHSGLPLSIFAAEDAADVRKRFLGYSATILSFLGAIHWGTALADGATGAASSGAPKFLRFGWSVVPSLVAWGGLSMQRTEADYQRALAVMAGGFAAAFAADVVLLPKKAAWFRTLRGTLTGGVIGLHAVASALTGEAERERVDAVAAVQRRDEAIPTKREKVPAAAKKEEEVAAEARADEAYAITVAADDSD